MTRPDASNDPLGGTAANPFDAACRGVFEAREADWRIGALVYQVLPDRFAPPADLAAKRALYPPPKVLRDWSELPRRGHYLPEQRLWSHEIDFWGGDLASLRERLPYLQALGVEVLYLNPIHLAYTNHKYDALDHAALSPEFGTLADFRALTDAAHAAGLRVVLDGVFNHMGRQAPAFQSALSDPASPWRDWFHIGAGYHGGYRSWWRAENLPELNLEHAAVRRHLWDGPEAVVPRFLRDGADGWRLDVAVDIGFDHLQAITAAAHRAKPGSLVVGEVANYPKEWFPAVDGVILFTLRELLLRLVRRALTPAVAQRMVERLIIDCGTEHLLRSWLMLDNHDTPRLATAVPDEAARRLAQLLQFTLPCCPNLYYGSELDMTGGDDPEMRAPMRWDLVDRDPPSLQWLRQLIRLRRQHRALRVGDYRAVDSGQLFAFERHTDRVADTVVVVVNPGPVAVQDTLMVANAKLMNTMRMLDPFAPEDASRAVPITAGLLDLHVPAGGFRVLVPEITPAGGYSAYKRVR